MMYVIRAKGTVPKNSLEIFEIERITVIIAPTREVAIDLAKRDFGSTVISFSAEVINQLHNEHSMVLARRQRVVPIQQSREWEVTTHMPKFINE